MCPSQNALRRNGILRSDASDSGQIFLLSPRFLSWLPSRHLGAFGKHLIDEWLQRGRESAETIEKLLCGLLK